MFTKQGKGWVPKKTHKFGTAFSAGVWNIGTGGGRFTAATRKELKFHEKMALLKEVECTHVELHDSDVNIDGSVRDNKVAKLLMKIITDSGLEVSMVTANLFSRPEFINGNFGSPHEGVRKTAMMYTKNMIRLGHEHFNALRYVYWNGSQGMNCRCGQNPQLMFMRIADCLKQIIEWEVDEYGEENVLGIAIEPKHDEPASWGAPGSVGEALAIRSMLSPHHQQFVGVNPEFCHATMGGLNPAQEIGLAAACNSLFWIHLNGSTGAPKFDEDRPFGVDNINSAVEAVLALKQCDFGFPIGFDVQPYPTDTNDQQAASIATSILNFRRCLAIIQRIDLDDLRELQEAGDNQSIEMLLSDAITGIEQ